VPSIIWSSQAHPTHLGALSSRTTRVRIRAVHPGSIAPGQPFLAYTCSSCLPDPGRLAVPARPGVVRAAPTLPCVSTVRLPSASPACCDRSAAGPFHPRPVVVAPRAVPTSARRRHSRWAPHGCADHLGPGRAPHVIEHPGELAVPIAKTDRQ
jgi:hypothetical protein